MEINSMVFSRQKPPSGPAHTTSIEFSHGFLAGLVRSIARNEKSIVLRQCEKLKEMVSEKGYCIQDMDATPLFKSACHQRGAGVSTMLIQAGFRAHTSKAIKLALQRDHLDAFRAQIASITQHDPVNPFSSKQALSGHLLSTTILKGLAGPLDRLLDKPVPFSDLVNHRRAPSTFLTPQQAAEFLLLTACTLPPPHDAIETLDILLARGANPRSWRVGIGSHWLTADADRSWVCSAFHVGNMELGLRILVRILDQQTTPSEAKTLGYQCAAAILGHADTVSVGPARLDDHHRKAIQAIDGLGLPLPTPTTNRGGCWTYKSDAGDLRPIYPDCGEWLKALS